MKNVLFITDSLGLPRSSPELVSDDEVWPYQLSDTFKGECDFRFFMINGLNTSLLSQYCSDHLLAYKPDIVILQIGIVDCCPRALAKKELLIAKNLPKPISRVVHKLVKKYHKQIIIKRKIRYVTPEAYQDNLHKLKNLFSTSEFIVVPIAPATDEYAQKIPMLEESISLYNAIKKSVFQDALLTECYEGYDKNTLFLSDHHHLTARGHAAVYESVRHSLNNLIKSQV